MSNDKVYSTYIYTDSRKITEQQYDQMLSDILEEAAACFEMSGLNKNIDVSGKKGSYPSRKR